MYAASDGRTNVRVSGSKDAQISRQLNPGQSISVRRTDEAWWEVRDSGTRELFGWVHKSRLREDAPSPEGSQHIAVGAKSQYNFDIFPLARDEANRRSKIETEAHCFANMNFYSEVDRLWTPRLVDLHNQALEKYKPLLKAVGPIMDECGRVTGSQTFGGISECVHAKTAGDEGLLLAFEFFKLRSGVKESMRQGLSDKMKLEMTIMACGGPM
jgi:hypothetical protein